MQASNWWAESGAVGVIKSLFASLEFFGRPCGGSATKLSSHSELPISALLSHLLFQLYIWILVREPAEGKVVLKEEDGLVKAVAG